MFYGPVAAGPSYQATISKHTIGNSMRDKKTLTDHQATKTGVGISAQSVTVTYRNDHTALWNASFET